MSKTIGYKGFKKDIKGLYCQPKQTKTYYKVGKIYEVEGELSLCNNGFHFCSSINCVHDYYHILNDVVCEVEILGDVVTDGTKSCTNKIKILKKLTKQQVLELSNIGYDNTGVQNSGNCNSGNYNSGNYNSGNRNSGNRNSGDRNSGNRNSGDWNSGNWNSGDWNSGFFNTDEPTIRLFNNDTEMKHSEFYDSKYYAALVSEPLLLTDYIDDTLITYDYKEACQIWWNKLTDENKKIIRSMPNFDTKIFEKITGIKNLLK